MLPGHPTGSPLRERCFNRCRVFSVSGNRLAWEGAEELDFLRDLCYIILRNSVMYTIAIEMLYTVGQTFSTKKFSRLKFWP